MDNFTIYREGKRDIIATLAVRIRVKTPRVIDRIDAAWMRLYEI